MSNENKFVLHWSTSGQIRKIILDHYQQLATAVTFLECVIASQEREPDLHTLTHLDVHKVASSRTAVAPVRQNREGDCTLSTSRCVSGRAHAGGQVCGCRQCTRVRWPEHLPLNRRSLEIHRLSCCVLALVVECPSQVRSCHQRASGARATAPVAQP